VKEVESATDRTYVFFNNHFHGKSAQNAQMFAKMLGVKIPDASAAPAKQLGLGGLSVES
jgi:uncharacterized protein YecE (DUF72 family)